MRARAPTRPKVARKPPGVESPPAEDRWVTPAAAGPLEYYDRAWAVAVRLEVDASQWEHAVLECGCPAQAVEWTEQDCAMVISRLKIAKGVR